MRLPGACMRRRRQAAAARLPPFPSHGGGCTPHMRVCVCACARRTHACMRAFMFHRPQEVKITMMMIGIGARTHSPVMVCSVVSIVVARPAARSMHAAASHHSTSL